MPINYKKSMFENFNLAVIFEVEETKDIIPCQALFELSRLINLSDSHSLRIMGYSTKKQEEDLITDNRIFDTAITSVFAYSYYNSYYFSGQNNPSLKSIIITTDTGEKLLIINDIDSIRSSIENGNLLIYF